MWKYDETTAWNFCILKIPNTIFWFNRLEYSSFFQAPANFDIWKVARTDFMKHIDFRVYQKLSCREHVIFWFLDTAQTRTFMKLVDSSCLSKYHWLRREYFVVFDVVITRFWWSMLVSRVYQKVNFVVLRIYDLLMLTKLYFNGNF